MDSGIMARLEIEDPLLACHDQTAGWLNRVWVESGRGEGADAWLRGWGGVLRDTEEIVRRIDAHLPLEYGEQGTLQLLAERRKRGRNGARSRNSALLATDLSGDDQSILPGKR